MKIQLLIMALLLTLVTTAQNLKTFTVTLDADSNSYLSISQAKTYSLNNAVVVKESLDLGLFKTMNDKTAVIEIYNLKPDNEKAPAAVWGTKTKVAAISFDRDQFDKCKTVADLKRMTGYLSSNSLSHFAVVRSSADYYQRCFIIEKENGKRALVFVTDMGGGSYKAEVKTE